MSSDKILYCAGPFNTYNARFLYTPDKDEVLFQRHKDIIELTAKYNLTLHIKVHPSGEAGNYAHFKYLCRNYKHVKVIGGYWRWFNQAERMVDKYQLVILDILRTALLPVMAQKTVPTILYTTRGMKEFHLQKMRRILYVINSKKELEGLLKKFSFGELYIPENEQLLKKWFEKRETIQKWYHLGMKDTILRRKFRHEWKNDGTYYMNWNKLLKRLKRRSKPPDVDPNRTNNSS